MFALPSNENREKAVIGAILIDQDYFEAASEIVSASDFYHVRPKICWEVMEKLHGRGDEIDAITLYAEIDKQAKRDLVSVSFPNECMNCVAVPSHVGTYAQDVKRLSQRRSIIVAAHETAEQAETADDLDAVAGHASDRLRTIAMDNVQHETPLVGTDVDEALEDATRVGTPEGLVKTGIPEFDSKYAGLWPGLLTVLASRPSMGKSMFALNVVTNAALAGHPVCLVSLEDTRRFVQWRIMARLGDVRLQSIVERSLDDTDRQRLAKAAETMKGLPLYIEDGAGLTSAKIRNLITSQHRTRKYELIVIDHLAHIREPGLDKYQSITINSYFRVRC